MPNKHRAQNPRSRLLIAMISAFLLLTGKAQSDQSRSVPNVGDEYEISKRYETTEQASDGSSGSSSGRDDLLERVIGMRDGGLILEFDLPKNATVEDRQRSWQFPVHVFRPNNGAMQLLNDQELEARLDGWLKAANWTRAACGQWIFTWNAFRIECDPQSVIKTLETFDLNSAAIREGAPYRDIEAKGIGTLTSKAAGPNGSTFTVVMEIDPDAVRRARAESDVVVGTLMQKSVTLEDALREREKADVSGTISVTIDTDPAGNVRRRTKVTRVETHGQGDRTETQTVTETVERRPVSTSGNASPPVD